MLRFVRSLRLSETPMSDWLLGGLQFFIGVVILIAVWQITLEVAAWVKRRWL